MKNELTFDRQKYQRFNKIMANDVAEIYQCDTLVYQKPKINRKGIYLTVIVDVYSRLVGAMIRFDQEANTNLKTFRKIIKKYFYNTKPKELSIDDGTEFKNVFQDYCKKKNIDIKIAESDGLRNEKIHLKQSIVERMNGTLRTRILEMTAKHNRPLSESMLETIINQLNTRIHSSIGEKPRDVFLRYAVPTIVLRKHNIPARNSQPLEYKVGDRVRITLRIKKMSENSKRKELNSRDVYRIEDRIGNRYLLSNGLTLPYTRLVRTKSPVTESQSTDQEAPKPKNTAPKLKKKEQEKKMRLQPIKEKDLIPYNEHHNQPTKQLFELNQRVKVLGSTWGGAYKTNTEYFNGKITQVIPNKDSYKYEIAVRGYDPIIITQEKCQKTYKPKGKDPLTFVRPI